MTISVDQSRVVHVANGTATFFSSSPIEGLDATNIKVTTISTTGTETVRVLGVDYTITTGGITFASPPANGTSVVIQRIVPLLQPDQYLVNAPFPARVTEARFDQVVMGLQQLSDELGRTLRVSIGEGTFTALLPRPAQRANRLLGFDAAGAPIAVTGNQIGDVLITPFGEALIALPDAAAARTELELGTAALFNVGTAATEVVQLDSAARLPAVDGSQLTGLTASQISGLPPPVGLSEHRGLTIANTLGSENTTLNVSWSSLILENSAGEIVRVGAASGTVAITSSGANGLDTGTEAANTWYHVWGIWGSMPGPARLLSASATSPTLPAGYTHRCYLGAVYNDSSSNFVRISQRRKRVDYTTHRTIYEGGLTAATWTAISISAFFPSTAVAIRIAQGGESGNGIAPRSTGVGGSYVRRAFYGNGNTMGVFPTARDGWATHEITMPPGNDTVYAWITASVTVTMSAIGWSYE